MKKILILAMSCQNEYFKKQIDIIEDTWAKDLPEGMTFGYYDGDWSKTEKVWEGKYLHIKTTSKDSLESTFAKTVCAISEILSDYDYIFRVNTSTWTNVRLLRKFVDEMAKDDMVYASELYSLTEAACPFPLCLYARGNAFLMSSKLWTTVVTESLPLLYMNIVDDVAIGNTVNVQFIKNNENYEEHYTGLPHGWYKASGVDINVGHRICSWGKAGNAEFYKNFMTVQTKMYRHRENELENMREFAEMMMSADEPSLELCKDYMEDPSVFIGSVLGYIPLSAWKRIDKNRLYAYEMSHKAIDDKQNPNFSQEAYDRLHMIPKVK